MPSDSPNRASGKAVRWRARLSWRAGLALALKFQIIRNWEHDQVSIGRRSVAIEPLSLRMMSRADLRAHRDWAVVGEVVGLGMGREGMAW
jgi:hypothetical protein